jgi:hypothetical protein
MNKFPETTQRKIDQLLGRRILAHLPHHGNSGKIHWLYVVSESGTNEPVKMTDTLRTSALFPGGPIIAPSFL